MGHQNSRHHHLDRRHNLLYDSSWKDLNQYKLLTIQTAWHFSDKLWLNYNITFRKEAAASGCHMQPDLYNFHTISLATTSAASGSSTSSALSLTEPLASSGNPKSSQYWHSWNDGCCCWPFGHCRFRHFAKHATGTTLASAPSPLCMETLVLLPFSVKKGSPPWLGHLS